VNTNVIRAAIYTALQTFAGVFALTAFDWLQDVAEWASSSGREPLPGLSVLGYAAVAGVCAAASGLVTLLIRWAQAANVLGGAPPTYTPN
jgi:hypothetical protein